ncbi:7-cyano-7-deazaguanine synthase [Lysobacter sp. KIS68-7]|uniref:7-cyano-7-deazaguanine synthase n=1 Tax=Lysobacter sp. KIS68-7 TaxID=2904252 RepID=UPI001E564089|nr:7-cyano-7-deazaguanine synthase [Lysobacter sp. KIS68-7]UHQ19089.1 7-cyano-7-deazaguanine synthase [Lysobacter sp. KIS68-7]
MDKAPVSVFWTSGWDSTFRLLFLLLEHRLPVAPTYVVDPTRGSAGAERQAMARIREALFEQHPHTRELLLPVNEVPLGDIAPDPGLTRAFRRLAVVHHLGDQYDWLARYCKQRGLDGVELSVERTFHGPHGVLHGRAIRVTDAHGLETFRVPPEYEDADALALFGAFSMPLFDMTKEDTADVARRHGWLDILGLTWFCHRPTRDGNPCGICNPCLYAIEQGFGWRVSERRRAMSAVYRRTLLPLRRFARSHLLKRRARAEAKLT